ncbi:Low complexity protein [Diplonema papillatum]|nr:Low complexity protein [Diplonema papillatum]
MVDYGKFDKLAREVDAEEAARQPRVTRLEGATSVRIGKDGVRFEPAEKAAPAPAKTRAGGGIDYSRWDNLSAGSDDELPSDGEAGEEEEEHAPMSLDPQPQSAPSPVSLADTPAAAPPGSRARASATRNGGVVDARGLFWAQDQDTVTVHFVVDPGTKAKAVSAAVAPPRGLVVSVAGSELPAVAGRQLAFAVESDEEGSSDVDWELVADEQGRRCLKVVLRKAHPAGTRAWWDRVFVGDPAIPADAIVDRSLAKAEEAKKVWEDAHRMFREKVKNRPLPTVIDE